MNKIKCGLCDGSGKSTVYSALPCMLCQGHRDLDLDPAFTELCTLCDGSGKSTANQQMPCMRCNGRRYVAPRGYKAPLQVLPPEDLPMMVFIQAGKPWTAHLQLDKIFENVTGEIRICDPYYGKKSLLSLDLLKHCKPIKFLTSKPDSSESQTIKSALEAWKKENGDVVEFRKASGRDLHDRFIISQHELILLGHGLKDVGTKDSFIVRVSRDLAGDMIDTVRESFDDKWEKATLIN
jgi:hypothetical protein